MAAMSGMSLPDNDKHIQKFHLSIDAELAKGSEADTEKLLMLIEAVNVLTYGSMGAVHRVKQRERTHKADEQHEILIGSHRNWIAKGLNAASGSIGVAGAIGLSILVIGGSMAGVSPAGVQAVMDIGSKILTLATTGFSASANAAQSGDQADINKYDYAVKNEQTERSDDQSTGQAVEGQKAESLRRMKDAHQQKSAAWSAAASASR